MLIFLCLKSSYPACLPMWVAPVLTRCLKLYVSTLLYIFPFYSFLLNITCPHPHVSYPMLTKSNTLTKALMSITEHSFMTNFSLHFKNLLTDIIVQIFEFSSSERSLDLLDYILLLHNVCNSICC